VYVAAVVLLDARGHAHGRRRRCARRQLFVDLAWRRPVIEQIGSRDGEPVRRGGLRPTPWCCAGDTCAATRRGCVSATRSHRRPAFRRLEVTLTVCLAWPDQPSLLAGVANRAGAPLPRVGRSNVAAFVLCPVVKAISKNDGALRIELAPPAATTQRVTLLLNAVENEPQAPSAGTAPAYGFDARRREGSDDPVLFDVGAAAPGDYLVRVRVDRAESPLEVDETGRYCGPRVTIP
jgi:hypothetical protein